MNRVVSKWHRTPKNRKYVFFDFTITWTSLRYVQGCSQGNTSSQRLWTKLRKIWAKNQLNASWYISDVTKFLFLVLCLINNIIHIYLTMNLYTASQFTICLKQAFLSSFAFPLSFFLIGCLSQKVRAASGWGFSGQSVSELNILQISSLFEITQMPKKKTVKTSVYKIIRNWESFLVSAILASLHWSLFFFFSYTKSQIMGPIIS